MKAFVVAFCLLTAPVVLTACQTIPAVSSTADEKALILLERTFSGSLLAVNSAVDAGQLKGANAKKASELLATAKAQLDQARALYRLGQVLQTANAISAAQSTLTALAALSAK